jgi:phenylalanyl-tRNA synthetase alpha chain
MGSLEPEARKEFGKAANSVRAEIEALLEEKFAAMKELQKADQFIKEKIDVTEPGVRYNLGVKHPITITIDEISRIFMSMGFSIAEGPEVETVFNNFDALNAPPNHPSRDMSDTFYITENTLLRTQTSPVQARVLMKENPPIKIISPGRCFRVDTPMPPIPPCSLSGRAYRDKASPCQT